MTSITIKYPTTELTRADVRLALVLYVMLWALFALGTLVWQGAR